MSCTCSVTLWPRAPPVEPGTNMPTAAAVADAAVVAVVSGLEAESDAGAEDACSLTDE